MYKFSLELQESVLHKNTFASSGTCIVTFFPEAPVMQLLKISFSEIWLYSTIIWANGVYSGIRQLCSHFSKMLLTQHHLYALVIRRLTTNCSSVIPRYKRITTLFVNFAGTIITLYRRSWNKITRKILILWSHSRIRQINNMRN